MYYWDTCASQPSTDSNSAPDNTYTDGHESSHVSALPVYCFAVTYPRFTAHDANARNHGLLLCYNMLEQVPQPLITNSTFNLRFPLELIVVTTVSALCS